MPKKATLEDYERRILLAQEHIASHLDHALEPAHVARISGFSKHHFHRIFRGLTGESMMGFTRRLRLERSARLLRSGSRPVTDLALESGYASHEAFTRAFSERFSMSPSQFRESTTVLPKTQPTTSAATVTVEIRQEDALDLVFMQHTGSYADVGVVWQRFMTWLASSQCTVAVDGFEVPKMYGLVPDDPEITETNQLRYQACFVNVNGASLPDGPVARTSVPEGSYAVAIHRGSYASLHETYVDLIGRWFPQSSYVPAHAPVVEHYLNSPHNTAPDRLETEIRVLIDEAGW